MHCIYLLLHVLLSMVYLLDRLLEVFSPLGRKTIVDSEVWDCVISFDRHGLVTDLTTLDMGKFDAILGMDWLSIWHATLDCFTKKVCF